MSERIIIAIIGVLGTFAGNYVTHKKSMALIEYRMKQLEEKVNKHNNLIDRMYKAETNIEVIQEEVKNLQK